MIDPGWETRPRRTFVGLVALLVALFFGGMAVGLAIALSLGGGSVGAIVVGFGFLPLVLGLGMSAWRGIVFAWLGGGLLRAIIRSRGDEAAFRAATREHLAGAAGGIPGTWVFLPVAAVVSLGAGLVMAIVADGDRGSAAAATVVVGLGYGYLLARLARRGLLPPPEE